MRALLELGADPDAGGRRSTPLGAVTLHHPRQLRNRIAELLLQNGADCLLPAPQDSIRSSTSIVAGFATFASMRSSAALRLAHLERQRSAGQLQLGSAARAAQLLLACIKCGGHQQLFNHSLRRLEEHLSARATGLQPAAAVKSEVLHEILVAAIGDIHDISSCTPADVEALLICRLPLDLNNTICVGMILWSPLRSAALRAGDDAAAKVRLLHQAGASLTAEDLLHLIDGRLAAGLAALLSAGSPAVDTRRPSLRVEHVTSYSCPIHRTLHTLVRCPAVKHCDALPSNGFGGVLQRVRAAAQNDQAGMGQLHSLLAAAAILMQVKPNRRGRRALHEFAVLRMLEALRAAGYPPTVWRQAAPPDFLRLRRQGAVPEVFDPFDFSGPRLSPR